MRSNSFSIRDAFENLAESPANARKSIYLPVSGDVPAVKVKILVPLLSATKLMKFEISSKVKDIIRVLILKHRFSGQIEEFILVHKADHEALDLPLEHEKSLQDYHIKDNDQLELKASNSTAMNAKPKPAQEPQPNDNINDEAIPPPELVAISTLRRNNKVVQEAKKTSESTEPQGELKMANDVPQDSYSSPAPTPASTEPRSRSQSEAQNSKQDPPRRNTQADQILNTDRRNTNPPPPPQRRASLEEPEQTPPPLDSSLMMVEVPPEEASFLASPKEEILPSSPKQSSPISQATPPTRTGTSRIQTSSNPANSPEPTKKNGDTSLVEVIGSVFRLENGTWKPLDGGSARIAIIMNIEGKYRVVALSQSGQFVLNSWIRTERPFKRVSETFCNFPSVTNRQHVTYGLRMRSSDDAAQFTSIFESCVEKLKETQAKTGVQSEPASPQVQTKPEEPVKLRETFNL